MKLNQLIDFIEQKLSRPLSPVERFVFMQSWDGRTYQDIARASGYDSVYVKQVGSQLWQVLSEKVGQKVTKKNLHIVFDTVESSVSTVSRTTGVEFAPLISASVQMPSGPLPFNSPLYIERPPIEALVTAEIEQPGSAICIRGPHKIGKSSLVNRLLHRARHLEYATVTIDFQEADSSCLSSLDRLLRWFCANVSRQLDLPNRLNDYWDSDIGSKMSCKIYFEHHLLPQLEAPLVLVLHDSQRLFEYPELAPDFLSMLRSWHEQARSQRIWQQLRLVVVYNTEIYASPHIEGLPFNLGLLVDLPPLHLDGVRQLAECHGLVWGRGAARDVKVQNLMSVVGGNPYLLNLAFSYLRQGELSLDELLQRAPTQGGIYGNYLRERLLKLRSNPKLAQAVQTVVEADNGVELEALTAHKLESMGFIQLDGNQARPSSQMLRLYLREQLSREDTGEANEEMFSHDGRQHSATWESE